MRNRRDFMKMLIATVPSAAVAGWAIDSKFGGVALGAQTYSFRAIPREPGSSDRVDIDIRALKECGIGEIELFSPDLEPPNPTAGRAPTPSPAARSQSAPAPAQRRMSTPEAREAREKLRQWRLTTPVEHFQSIRRRFNDAGIQIYAYTINYREDFTDEEIEKTFEQARGLGVGIIATSTQLTMAQRLVPFAAKHKMTVAFHGHDRTDDPNEFSTPETFQKALDMSPYFKVNLDIGHFTAAGYDPLSYIRQHHARITHLHVKDRKKNHGPNLPWGEGDTPIREVLLLLKQQRYPIPAFVEYEYQGTGTPVEETKKCVEYMKKILS
jgi:sugar phosphate isomerase/epimerase